jgi:peptidyl-prolyl cis-trans isomerase B (cyclophilin B)
VAEHFVKQDTSNAFLLDAIAVARETQDMGMYKWATDSIVTLADKANLPWYSIPEDQRQIYRTVGGTPHLDQNYTVFGQVIEGMDVVDAIAATETSDADRPVKDVRILTARIIKE